MATHTRVHVHSLHATHHTLWVTFLTHFMTQNATQISVCQCDKLFSMYAHMVHISLECPSPIRILNHDQLLHYEICANEQRRVQATTTVARGLHQWHLRELNAPPQHDKPDTSRSESLNQPTWLETSGLRCERVIQECTHIPTVKYVPGGSAL
jgi:hypothetical protein